MFAILLAANISLVAWLAQNVEDASMIQLVIVGAGVIGVTVAAWVVNRMGIDRIGRLEEL